MDGIVAAQLIRALGARGAVPIVALTDARERVATTRGRAVGFAAALLKPYSPRELFQAHVDGAGAPPGRGPFDTQLERSPIGQNPTSL